MNENDEFPEFIFAKPWNYITGSGCIRGSSVRGAYTRTVKVPG